MLYGNKNIQDTVTDYGTKVKDIEYSVYVYHAPQGKSQQGTQWERNHITKSMNYALARAKVLMRSDDYYRVEVKCTHRDLKTAKAVNKTFRVFKNKPQRKRRWFSFIK